jgi:uncharacterized repeat protein (TIGR01451 family)
MNRLVRVLGTATLLAGLLQGSAIAATIYDPIGSLDDGARRQVIGGWTCQPHLPTKANKVHLYVDGEYGQGGWFIKELVANQPAEQGVQDACGGQSRHRFEIPYPKELCDGNEHLVYAYGISDFNSDPNDGENALLYGSPRRVRCYPEMDPYPPYPDPYPYPEPEPAPQAFVELKQRGPRAARAESKYTYSVVVKNVGDTTSNEIVISERIPGTFIQRSGTDKRCDIVGDDEVVCRVRGLRSRRTTSFSIRTLMPEVLDCPNIRYIRASAEVTEGAEYAASNGVETTLSCRYGEWYYR